MCIEPDPDNISFLECNLVTFPGRYILLDGALVDKSCTQERLRFYQSNDGKYSSLIPGQNHVKTVEVPTITIDYIEDILGQRLNCEYSPLVVKLDTEGTEELLIKALEATCKKHNLYKLFAEGNYLQSQDMRSSAYSRELINNYITVFTDKQNGVNLLQKINAINPR